jgi:hypothetical protein
MFEIATEISLMVDKVQDLPLVSILMPVRNEQKAIKNSLSAALSQIVSADRLKLSVNREGLRQYL